MILLLSQLSDYADFWVQAYSLSLFDFYLYLKDDWSFQIVSALVPVSQAVSRNILHNQILFDDRLWGLLGHKNSAIYVKTSWNIRSTLHFNVSKYCKSCAPSLLWQLTQFHCVTLLCNSCVCFNNIFICKISTSSKKSLFPIILKFPLNNLTL